MDNRFATGLQYRAAAAAGIVTQFVWGLMELLLYKAFYETPHPVRQKRDRNRRSGKKFDETARELPYTIRLYGIKGRNIDQHCKCNNNQPKKAMRRIIVQGG